MATLALNKSSLKQQRDQLSLYEKFLPSLDLKRQQLMVELKKAREAFEATGRRVAEMEASLDRLYPLVGATAMDLHGYVTAERIDLGKENILGVALPVLRDVGFDLEEYSTLTRPFWVDTLTEAIQAMARLRIEHQVDRRRVDLLDEAVRKVTQRVNLFEKVLIPNAQRNIQRIQIFLGDAERAAVVRSKIVKAKHEQQARQAG